MRWYEVKAMERSHVWLITRRGGPAGPNDARRCSACGDDNSADVHYCTGTPAERSSGASQIDEQGEAGTHA